MEKWNITQTQPYFYDTEDRYSPDESMEVRNNNLFENELAKTPTTEESLLMDSYLNITVALDAKEMLFSNTLAADNGTIKSAHSDVLLRDRHDGHEVFPAAIINTAQSSSNLIAQRKLASPKLILLVNSLGRGGSTFVADILSTFGEKTFYIFEPLVQLQAAHIQITEESSSKVLDFTLSCKLNELKKMGPMHRLMRSHIKRGCLSTNCITNLCLNADLRMAKVIMYFKLIFIHFKRESHYKFLKEDVFLIFIDDFALNHVENNEN